MSFRFGRSPRSYCLSLACALLGIGWFVLSPKKAMAQPVPGLSVVWEAPAHCPQQPELIERVRKLAGPANSAPVALEVEGAITGPDNGHFHLKLVMRSGGAIGVRNIDSVSCTDLTRAAGVAIALLLRSEATLSDTQDSPDVSGDSGAPISSEDRNRSQPPSAPAREVPPPPPAKAPVIASPSNGYLRLRVPLAAVSVGPLPRPDWGVAVALGAGARDFRVWLQATDWLHQDVPAKDYPGYSATVSRISASLQGCWARRFSAFEVAPCVVISAEHITARGAGQNIAAQTQHVTWFGGGLGAQGRLYLANRFSLVLSVEGIAQASRPKLTLGGVGLVDELGAASFVATLGPEWIL